MTSIPSISTAPKQRCDATEHRTTKCPTTSAARERKRIQNRFAQRNYRSRVKARLTNLQARLDVYENASALASVEPENARESVADPSMPAADTSLATSLTHGIPTPELYLSPKRRELDSSHRIAGDVVGRSMTELEGSAHCVPANNGLVIATNLLMLSQPNTNLPESRNALENMEQDESSDMIEIGDESSALLLNEPSDEMISLSEICHVRTEDKNLPTPLEYDQLLCLGFPPLSDGTGTTEQITPLDGHSSSIFPPATPATGEATRHATDQNTIPAETEATPIPLEQQIESVLEHIEQQGFDSFDSVVRLYYSQTFTESSSMVSEQWMSRNRRLPCIIASIFESSMHWSQSEQRLLNDQIFKASENLLNSEVDAARGGILLRAEHVFPQGSCQPAAEISKQTVLAMKVESMNKCPHWWTLLMGLMSTNHSLPLRGRANLALAINLMIQCSGIWNKQQILQILDSLL